MTEICLQLLCTHYGLYPNAPVQPSFACDLADHLNARVLKRSCFMIDRTMLSNIAFNRPDALGN